MSLRAAPHKALNKKIQVKIPVFIIKEREGNVK
jgi:hypothetical protein